MNAALQWRTSALLDPGEQLLVAVIGTSETLRKWSWVATVPIVIALVGGFSSATFAIAIVISAVLTVVAQRVVRPFRVIALTDRSVVVFEARGFPIAKPGRLLRRLPRPLVVRSSNVLGSTVDVGERVTVARRYAAGLTGA